MEALWNLHIYISLKSFCMWSAVNLDVLILTVKKSHSANICNEKYNILVIGVLCQ